MFDNNAQVKFVIVIASDWHTIISLFRDEPYFTKLLDQKPSNEENEPHKYYLNFENTEQLYNILALTKKQKLETRLAVNIIGDYVDIWVESDPEVPTRVSINKSAIQDTSVEAINEAMKIFQKIHQYRSLK